MPIKVILVNLLERGVGGIFEKLRHLLGFQNSQIEIGTFLKNKVSPPHFGYCAKFSRFLGMMLSEYCPCIVWTKGDINSRTDELTDRPTNVHTYIETHKSLR